MEAGRVGDMLINLYRREKWVSKPTGFVRKAYISDRSCILGFVRDTMPLDVAVVHEVERGIMQNTCYICVEGGRIQGVAVYDSVGKGYCGPICVRETERKRGLGKELMGYILDEMQMQGYGYAVLGKIEDREREFFKKCFDAVDIPNSEPWVTLYKRKIKTNVI